MKTATKLCHSYTEAFNQRLSGTESPNLGLFTDQQLKYIASASEHLSKFEESYAPTIIQDTDQEKAEKQIKRSQD